MSKKVGKQEAQEKEYQIVRRKNNNIIPSRTSPKGSRRGCLCKDTNTYSRKCCDGSLWAQGIGVISRTAS